MLSNPLSSKPSPVLQPLPQQYVSLVSFDGANPVLTSRLQSVKTDDSPYFKHREAEATLEDLSESGRIFIRNLPYGCMEEDLENHFSKHGTLSEVHVARDKQSNTSKGFGFVQFMIPSDALNAFKALDGKIFQVHLIE